MDALLDSKRSETGNAGWMGRQLSAHLIDFHNPGREKIGEQFDAKKMIGEMAKSGVETVVLFSKDNYGYSYYDTKIGVKHPGLDFDYFGELVREAKKRGLRVLAYHALNIEYLNGINNTDWIITSKDGRKYVHLPNSRVREYGDENAAKTSGDGDITFSLSQTASDNNIDIWWKYPTFHFLCVNSPYIQEMLLPQLEEIIHNFDIDGFFIDTLTYPEDSCYCEYCRREMSLRGIDAENKAEVDRFREETMLRVVRVATEFIHGLNPDLMVGYNNTAYLGCRRENKWNDYWFWEAGNWQLGYFHTALYARYLRNTGNPFTLVASRFHQMWGDFGGYKHPNEFKYECAGIVANGGIAWLSTQMPNNCKIDRDTYSRVKLCNEYIREREEYCLEAVAPPSIAVYANEGYMYANLKSIIFTDPSKQPNYQGATKLLMEAHQQFDVIDETMPLEKYKVLILPEVRDLDADFIKRVRDFVAAGGTLISTHMSGFGGHDFTLADVLGVNYVCTSPYSRCYARITHEGIARGLAEDFIVYDTAVNVKPADGVEILGHIVNPLFERTKERFHSHAQAPSGRQTAYPVATIHKYGKGKAVYVAFPVFSLFFMEDYYIYRNFLENILTHVYPDNLIREVNGPRSMEINLMEQPGKSRYILHFINCQTRRYSHRVPRVEDIVPLRDVTVKLALDKPVKAVHSPLGGTVEWTLSDGILSLRMSEVEIHNMAVIDVRK